MASFSERLKFFYIKGMRGVGRIAFLLPVKKNRVLFESFAGDGYSCNPKYISKALQELYGDRVEIIWAVKDGVQVESGVKACRFRSLAHIKDRITAQVYVCNYLQAMEIPKRKRQVEIQTWHGGGCYKKVGSEEKVQSNIYRKRVELHVAETDYFLASSQYFEEREIREQFGYSGKVLEVGLPRNDILFMNPIPEKIRNIREAAGIDEDAFAVLYAPTWREGIDEFEDPDYVGLKQAFEKKYKRPCQILFRAHLYGRETGGTGCLDLTSYPDMQELLYACDCLITDYSSCMWDFCLTEKPCFLYVPDLDRYTEQRGFNKDIHTWGFPLCPTNRDLIEAIEAFDQVSFKENMHRHREDLISFENGDASIQVAKLIGQICGLEA